MDIITTHYLTGNCNNSIGNNTKQHFLSTQIQELNNATIRNTQVAHTFITTVKNNFSRGTTILIGCLVPFELLHIKPKHLAPQDWDASGTICTSCYHDCTDGHGQYKTWEPIYHSDMNWHGNIPTNVKNKWMLNCTPKADELLVLIPIFQWHIYVDVL